MPNQLRVHTAILHMIRIPQDQKTSHKAMFLNFLKTYTVNCKTFAKFIKCLKRNLEILSYFYRIKVIKQNKYHSFIAKHFVHF
jgi:hypothetical protein